jgi:hypothetical protein
MFQLDNAADSMALALLELDIFKAIRFAAGLDAWFVTHLVDLLDACGLLNEDEPCVYWRLSTS